MGQLHAVGHMGRKQVGVQVAAVAAAAAATAQMRSCASHDVLVTSG